MSIVLRKVEIPDFGTSAEQPQIPGETFEARARAAYEAAGCDWLAVYGDREHFGNIIFLTGFDPRFEEAFLLLGPKDRRVLITGNECESYAALAGLPNMTMLLAQSLSLMAQDRTRYPRLADQFAAAGIARGDTVGLVGWKYLEVEEDDEAADAHFVPSAYVAMLRRLVGAGGAVRNTTRTLMHPETGLRATIDADQIAAFEWAAIRCSQTVWRMVEGAQVGSTEFDAVARSGYAGDPLNAHTMFASVGPGTPMIGLRSPNGRRLSKGDGVTAAAGYWGALSARAGLLDAENESFLKIASGYFAGLLAWYATADIDVEGGAIFAAVTDRLAEAGLSSALNPGHLTGHEEWMHSPIRPRSTDKLRSGMPFQVDIIPTPMRSGWTLNCEDPVTFADEELRKELTAKHPQVAARIAARRTFVRDQLGVPLKDSILPLSATPLCLPPFWLKTDHLLTRA